VLDACTTFAMSSPSAIAHDPVVAKHRRDKLGDTAVAAIGEHSFVGPAHRLDLGAAVVHWIVAIARPTAGDGDDA
jgi:hypothetical protein